jgi:hypothetical protein
MIPLAFLIVCWVLVCIFDEWRKRDEKRARDKRRQEWEPLESQLN